MPHSRSGKDHMQQSIRITSAALAHSDSDSILRGVLDPASLSTLLVAPYQREPQSHAKVRDIMRGFTTPARVLDIELGMRGHSFTQVGGDFFLPVPFTSLTVCNGGQQPWRSSSKA